MKPFFSIIVPVYQAEQTLERCVRSVLHQEFVDFEIVLVNDGSTDGSTKICDALAATDMRIHVIHQQNSGVSAARNAGISAAQGEYLLFLDSDDALMPNALPVYWEASMESTMDVVIAGLSVTENEKEIHKIGFDSNMQAGNEVWEQICCNPAPFGYAGGKLVRRSIVSENRITFNPNMKSQEDLDFFLSVYSFCRTFHMISDCLYVYYYAVSNRVPPVGDHLANQIKLLDLAITRTDISDNATNMVCSRVASMVYTGLYHAVENGTCHNVWNKLQQVKGLSELLGSAQLKREHGFVARRFAAGRYALVKNYFVVRRQVRDFVRFIKKR